MSNRFQDYNQGSGNKTYSNTTYQRTVQYSNGEGNQRVVYYQDGNQQPMYQQEREEHMVIPQQNEVEVEAGDFDEGVDVRNLQEELIDLDDLDKLLEDTNPEMKMMFSKKKGPTVMKTADEFDMHVSFKPPEKGKYPKENKRLPTKGERYHDVNTNFGRLT